jgi:peptide/nickel transport system permease protein
MCRWVIGASILLVMLVSSIFAPQLSRYDPNEQDLTNTLQPPSAEHLFGTDNFGRDIFSRVLHAAKLDLQIGVLCVLFPLIIGVLLGCLAGYLGGMTDTAVMRTVDIFTAFPFLVLVIAIIAILGPGLTSMYIALTLAGWSAYSRIVRGEILVAKKSEYIQAARSLGYGNVRIMLRHVLPNVITPVIIFAMADIILVILSTTSLSFLGLGVQPPTPEWGQHDRRRAQLHDDRLVDDHLPPGWRSCSWVWRSVSSAMVWPISCGLRTSRCSHCWMYAT